MFEIIPGLLELVGSISVVPSSDATMGPSRSRERGTRREKGVETWVKTVFLFISLLQQLPPPRLMPAIGYRLFVVEKHAAITTAIRLDNAIRPRPRLVTAHNSFHTYEVLKNDDWPFPENPSIA